MFTYITPNELIIYFIFPLLIAIIPQIIEIFRCFLKDIIKKRLNFKKTLALF
jgi:hypothetical protein